MIRRCFALLPRGQLRPAAGDPLGEISDREHSARVVDSDMTHGQVEATVLVSRHTEDLIALSQKQPDNAHRPRRGAATNHLGPAVAGKPRGIRRHVDERLVVGNHMASVAAERR